MNKNIFIWIVISSLIVSCYKEAPVIPIDMSKPSGYIYYSAFGRIEDSAGYQVKQMYFQGNAYFFSTPLMNGYQAEIVGDVWVGGLRIPFDSIYYYQFSLQHLLDPINPQQFGRHLQFSLEGGGSYAAANCIVYAPQIIYINTPLDSLAYTHQRMQSRRKAMKISWNPDPNNKQVMVNFFYDGIASNKNNPQLSNQSFYTNGIAVPDNGSFMLDSSLFAEFAPQSVVQIQISRGGKGRMKSNNHWVEVTADTYSNKAYTMVE